MSNEVNPSKIITELSIEETNKIRLSLGLKPLKVDTPKKLESQQQQQQQQQNDSTNEIGNTIAELKKKRERNQKPKGKTIAEQLFEDDDNDNDDISSWVQKSRNIQKQQQKQLKKPQQQINDPKSLIVMNDIGAFQDGREHILILKDSNVLDEDQEDTLMDVKISAQEKRAKLLSDSKKPNKLDKFDEYGAPIEILSQYSDNKSSINGFTINNINSENVDIQINSGNNNDSVENQQEIIKKRLEQYSSYDLDSKSVMQSAFYTQEEMERFKKKPATSKSSLNGGSEKKKKIRKKKESDSILEGLDETSINDRGSRNSRIDAPKNEEIRLTLEKQKRDINYQKALDKATAESKLTYSSDVFEESDDIEFYKSLSTAKKAPIHNTSKSIVEIVNSQKKSKEDQMKTNNDDDQYETDVSLKTNSVTEFVKTIKNEGLISNFKPTIKKEQQPQQTDQEMRDINNNNRDNDNEEEEEEEGEDDNTSLQKQLEKNNLTTKKTTTKSILEDEPLVSSSMSATLRLLMSKGELKPNTSTQGTHNPKKRKDIDYEDEGTVVQLEDQYGKRLTQRGLFVHQGQIFHGKKSGKNAIDKKLKAHQNELKQRQMLSSEVSQQGISQFQNYQKATSLPYLVLSGGLKDNPLLNLENNKIQKK